MMFYISYAIKSLLERRRQYISLFAVCTAAVGIILAVITITDGMLSAMTGKVTQYYGGELTLIGGVNYYRRQIPNASEIVEKIRPLLPEKTRIFERYDYDGGDVNLYFEGEMALCRMLKGVDFEAERILFKDFTFTEGDAEPSPSHDTVLLSEPVATKLGVHIGDSITILSDTVNESYNTAQAVVKGIFQDSSMFGMYTIYIDIMALRTLVAQPEDFVNRITMYFTDKKPTDKDIAKLQRNLEGVLNMYPMVKDKNQFWDAFYEHMAEWPIYGLITLNANRVEMAMMVKALSAVVTIIIIPLIMIVAIGIGSSYRVIVLKRTVETGTFRALGLRPSGVIKLFFTEIIFLLLVGFLLGCGLCAIITGILSTFNFSFVPAFDLFLTGGNLIPTVHPLKIALVLLIIAVTTMLSVLFTLRNLVHVSPAGAFATTV